MYKLALFLLCLALNLQALPTHRLTEIEKYDLQMLEWGGFAPLKTFNGQKDYQAILKEGRLEDGQLWPIPIVLTLDDGERKEAEAAGELLLVDVDSTILAHLKVENVYRPDVEQECISTFGCVDEGHPFMQKILSRKEMWYVSGELTHYKSLPLPEDCLPPAVIRDLVEKQKMTPMVGFQTRNPMHCSHFYLTMRALDQLNNGYLLLTPVIGPTQPGDVDAATRIKCYQALLKHYPKDRVKLCLIPLAMRMAGPKEACLHAIVRKNYGCTHFVVGRDHAGPSLKKKNGSSFFKPYEAQEYVSQLSHELGIEIIKSEELAYVQEDSTYQPLSQIEKGKTVSSISGTELRRMLETQAEIPEWFSFKEVVDILKTAYKKRGMCVYLCGLSGAGKTTLAQALVPTLEKLTGKNVMIIDADVVRKQFFPELGFSKEMRSMNVRRIGALASMFVANGLICIVANCAPSQADREFNRQLISQSGPYVEVYVNTPLDVCIQRDPKKIYDRYFKAEIKDVLGLDLAFEEPSSDLIVDGSLPLDTLVSDVAQNLAPHLMQKF
jgi:sulfate adenylyltransferase